jgi:tRNA (cmo5U34)-methyltransferase
VFAGLPADAHLLCVGAGTGVEMAFLAGAFPRWRFTALDPSGQMLAVCGQRAGSEGFASRCTFHEGYVDSLPRDARHDGATCLLVSQFIIEPAARIAFFGDIATRLRPGGILATADLATGARPEDFDALLRCWFDVMTAGGLDSQALQRMREAYARDVAVVAPPQVVAMLQAAGFANPVQFFQAGMMHAWSCSTAPA